MYVYIRVYIYIHTAGHIYAYIHTSTHAFTQIYTHIHMYAYIHTYTFIYTRAYTYIYACTLHSRQIAKDSASALKRMARLDSNSREIVVRSGAVESILGALQLHVGCADVEVWWWCVGGWGQRGAED